jgi:predicted HD superfamily hydrolase involved in NAD metabolism
MVARIRRSAHPLRRHLFAVARLAADLARRAGLGGERARAAGYLHDWLRPASRRLLGCVLRRYSVRLDPESRAVPGLWHGPAAAAMAERKWGVADGAVLSAVRWHTTGRPGATPLEMCLIVADFAEPGRRFREAAVARRLGRRNLRLAAGYVAASRMAYLIEAGIEPHPAAVAFMSSLAAGASKAGEAGTAGGGRI